MPVVADPPGELLVTGPVVGLLHRNEVWHAWLFRATDFCWQAAESLATRSRTRSRPPWPSWTPLRTVRARAAADRLGRLVREQRLAVLDPGDLDTCLGIPATPGASTALPARLREGSAFARARGSRTTRWPAPSTSSRPSRAEDDGGWPVAPAPVGTAPRRCKRARPGMTLEALCTLLRAYGRPLDLTAGRLAHRLSRPWPATPAVTTTAAATTRQERCAQQQRDGGRRRLRRPASSTSVCPSAKVCWARERREEGDGQQRGEPPDQGPFQGARGHQQPEGLTA